MAEYSATLKLAIVHCERHSLPHLEKAAVEVAVEGRVAVDSVSNLRA